jgi:hypothetical protein
VGVVRGGGLAPIVIVDGGVQPFRRLDMASNSQRILTAFAV